VASEKVVINGTGLFYCSNITIGNVMTCDISFNKL